MRDRFSPIPYSANEAPRRATNNDAEDGTAFEKVVKRLLEQRARGDVDSDDNRIHRIVAKAVALVQAASQPVYAELLDAAEALYYTGQVRQNAPLQLFYRCQDVKDDAQRAALERRLAAWFYLKDRIRVQELDKDDPKRTLYREVGRAAAKALYRYGGEQDIKLADQIREQLKL